MKFLRPLLAGLMLSTLAWPAHSLEMTPLTQPFQELAQSTTNRYTLALLPLRSNDITERPALSNYLRDKLLQSFTQMRAFDVIEREQIEAVLKEQGFSQSAFVNPDQGIALGNLLGARLLLAGSYTTLQDHLEVSLRLIDAEKGRVIFTAERKLAHSETTRELAQLKPASPTQDLDQVLKTVGSLSNAASALENILNPAGALLKPAEGSGSSPQQDPFAAPIRQRMLYEDFSAYRQWDTLPAIGPGFEVDKSLKHGRNVLKARGLSQALLCYPLALPRDFAIEIQSYTDWGSAPVDIRLTRADGQASLALRQIGNQFSLGPSLSAPAPWQKGAWNDVVLEKFRDQLKVYVNGQAILQAQIADVAWKGIEIASEDLDEWAFGRFALYRLSQR